MQLLPHCFCLNLLVGRGRLILLCLNETVCYIRFNHLACTASITIMIYSWEIDGATSETVTDFIFLGSKITRKLEEACFLEEKL